ncbi:uncharacterized protein LOC118747118 [Rhagoletis pomonella]|uniref:uncharacterized protein LOC118747118 n=1 Tax=Rhagoletis pomonella TaxID=28610 RepID=UPI00177FE397|nr:uncharacterized protein LOC118747118 [Rhagoletis pomonella]
MRVAMLTLAFGIFALVSCATASSNAVTYITTPLLRAYPYVYNAHSSSLVTPTQQQYHTQDGLGQYAYGYAEPHSAKQEVRSLDGITRGSYSYRDAAGKLQTVDYSADDHGFHVAATNLPRAAVAEQLKQQQQPFRSQETSGGSSSAADVATVRAIHSTVGQETLLRLSAGSNTGSESAATGSDSGLVQLPQPVDDTVAVAAAKADHLRRHAQEKQLHEFLHQGRVISPISNTIIPSIYHYGYPWRYYYSTVILICSQQTILIEMKVAMLTFAFGIFAAVSCASASSNAVTYITTPHLRAYPYVYNAHNTQDGLGQYAYGYAEPHSAKQEVRSLDGITRGSYNYRDAAGKLQTIAYTADDNGFRVAATNLPRAAAAEQLQQHQQPFRAQETSNGVPLTADVAAARYIHASAHREALLRLGARGKPSGKSAAARSDTGYIQLPQPVDDTVAVAAAKADHLRRHAQEKQLHTFIHQGRDISPISNIITPSIYHYGHYY